MLFPSQYNHLVHVTTPNGEAHHIVSNLFVGSCNVVNAEVFTMFQEAEENGQIQTDRLTEDAKRHFLQSGLLHTEPDREEQLIESTGGTYGDRDQIAAGLHGGQYGFITSLYCNLDCPYCFQKEKADSCGYLSKRQIDLGLDVIEVCERRVADLASLKNTIPKISITGGEPLLRNRNNLESVDYLMEQLDQRGWPFNITTNGTELSHFVTEHDQLDRCRNIQITLDGPKHVHDTRRCFRGGTPSFDHIVEGADAALRAGWKLTLRVNLDMSNVNDLPELVGFVEQRGWLDFENFSAYVSPVTDHGPIGGHEVPKDEADLLEAVLAVVEENPGVSRVFNIKHFRGFNYVRQMLVEKKPLYPVMFRCEAVTGMFIFDPKGDVHVCLEAVGDSNLRVGRYDPEFILDDAVFEKWANRNVLQLANCKNCKVRFVCAGGCALESFNKRDGEYCMPFLREMEIAWHYYGRTRPELFV